MRLPNIEHVYVVHCGQFSDRRTYLERAFRELKFHESYYDFVEHSFKDTLTSAMARAHYELDPRIRNRELRLIGEEGLLARRINAGSVSCGINHLNIWRSIAQTQRKGDAQTHYLVLEDDTLFFDDTLDRLVDLCRSLPADYDLISLEDGSALLVDRYADIVVSADKLVYKVPDGRMRCTGAYIVNSEACKRLCGLHEQRKFALEIDMQLWSYGKRGLLSVYWAHPVVFTQGSQNGAYQSEVQDSDPFYANGLYRSFWRLKQAGLYRSFRRLQRAALSRISTAIRARAAD